jgi:putative holliday junction resolvase
MVKAIGIDFGLKRTGLAITDDFGIIASPLIAIASEKLMSFLIDIIPKEKIKVIVLGYPTSMDGSDTHITENVRLFKTALEQEFSLPVILQDERMTSSRAMQAIHQGGKAKQKKKKGLVDTISATLILQDYLESCEL